MITIESLNDQPPYKDFKKFYELAKLKGQSNIDVISVSSFSITKNEVESRYVNLKYILDDEWIFFSNYNSNKATNFYKHNQISVLFYWDSINLQIRIKANIKKSDESISDEHFKGRLDEKNALAISSDQSAKIDSYEEVLVKYNNILQNNNLNDRPDHWGGFSFKPYYFEFWEGNNNRINKREIYELTQKEWINYFLEP